jgi:trehalose 2-sulfotransferase
MPGPAGTPAPTGSYLICATPRTGSSLLCGLLESTGVAGRPESYFRQPDEQTWAAEWGIVDSPDGGFRYADFVAAAVAAGRTENGVFAARVMWGTVDEMVDKLAAVYPDLADDALALLHRAFGHLRFVHVRRQDVLAQAVSWLRAEQTDVWHDTGDPGPERREQTPHFDLVRIEGIMQMIEEHNGAWEQWFASVGVEPYRVLYEDLDADAVGVTRRVLDFLGLEVPPGRTIIGRHVRLADEITTQWIDRYRTETAER